MFRQIFRLCRMQMCNLFGLNEFIYTKDKKKKRHYVAMALTWLLLIGMAVFYIGSLSVGIIDLGLGKVLPMYLYMMVTVFVLILTFFKAGSILFAMKGFEMTVALPVKKSAIVISRFLSMYITNLLLAVVIMMPGIIVYGMLEKPDGMFYVMCIIGTIFLPLLPLTLASIIGAIVMAISSRMRHKSIVQAVLMLVVLGLIFLVGTILPKANTSFSFTALFDMVSMLEEQLMNIYPPAVWFSRAVFGSYEYCAGFIGIPLVVFVVFIMILQRYFLSICTLLNGVSTKNNYKMKRLHARGVVHALWKKEIKRYFASGVYVTNTVAGYVVCVLLMVALLWASNTQFISFVGMLGINNLIEDILPFAISVMMTMSTMTASSISMEGKNLWRLQTLPVSGRKVYLGKILANLTVAGPFYVVSVVLACIAMNAKDMDVLWIAAIPACYIIFTSTLGLALNLLFPVLNWDNEVRVVKQSAATFLSMFLNIIVCVAPAVVIVMTDERQTELIKSVTVGVLVALTVIVYLMMGRKETHKIG